MEEAEDEEFWDWTGKLRPPEPLVKPAEQNTYSSGGEEDLNNNEKLRSGLINDIKNEDAKGHSIANNELNGNSKGNVNNENIYDKLFKSLDRLKPKKYELVTVSEDQVNTKLNGDDNYSHIGEEEAVLKSKGSYLNKDSKCESSDDNDDATDDKENTDPDNDSCKANIRLQNNFEQDSYNKVFEDIKTKDELEKHNTRMTFDKNETQSNKVPTFSSFVKKTSKKCDILNSNSDDETESGFEVHPHAPPFGKKRQSRRRRAHQAKDPKKVMSKENQEHQTGNSTGDGHFQTKHTSEEEFSCSSKKKQTKSKPKSKKKFQGVFVKDSEKQKGNSLSHSPLRMRKELRSGEFDWSSSKNEEVRDWVKTKDKIARRKKVEERRKLKKKSEDEENIMSSDRSLDRMKKKVRMLDNEEKDMAADERRWKLERCKRSQNRFRSSSYPGEDREKRPGVFPRSRSHQQLPKELRSGEFDWSKTDNNEIRAWIKRKNQLFRKQQAEEKRRRRLEKKKEEEKRKQREELFADSFERVSDWMRQKLEIERKKRKQEQLLKEKEKQEESRDKMPQFKSHLEKPDKVLDPTMSLSIRSIQEHEQIIATKQEVPLLKQREKQQQKILRNLLKQPDSNKGDGSKDIKKSISIGKQIINTAETHGNTTDGLNSLPSAVRKSDSPLNLGRRSVDGHHSLKQSLSLSKLTIPTLVKNVLKENEKLHKRITFDEWLTKKKAEDELKRKMLLRQKHLNADEKELHKSVEVKRIDIVMDVKQTGALLSAQKAESASGIAKPDLRSDQLKSNIASLEPSYVQLKDESDRARPKTGKGKGKPREGESANIPVVARAETLPNPYILGGTDIQSTMFRAKINKPTVSVCPQSGTVKYQKGSWEGFSNYLWDEVNKKEGGELVTSKEKVWLQSMVAEADRYNMKANKAEKINNNNDKSLFTTKEENERKSELYEVEKLSTTQKINLENRERRWAPPELKMADSVSPNYSGHATNSSIHNESAKTLIRFSDKDNMKSVVILPKEVDGSFIDSKREKISDARESEIQTINNKDDREESDMNSLENSSPEIKIKFKNLQNIQKRQLALRPASANVVANENMTCNSLSGSDIEEHILSDYELTRSEGSKIGLW